CLRDVVELRGDRDVASACGAAVNPENQVSVSRTVLTRVTQVEALPCAGVSNLCALSPVVDEIGRIKVACTPRPVLPARAERVGINGLIGLRTCFLGGDDQQQR